ncbi:MAG: DUF4123 domain-containing protein [Deltaproteobacteria bacterium]|nr:DUF4123 domain-containing protein [Deltaproteobacteria bacterium]
MITTRTRHTLFRVLPALCLAVLLAAPCAAHAARTGAARPSPSAPDAAQAALLDAIADRARQKAEFGARVAPVVAPLFHTARYAYRFPDPESLITVLWQLRSAPDVQRAWLDELAKPGLSDRERAERLLELDRFVNDTESLARDLQRRSAAGENLWTKFRDRFLTGTGGNSAKAQGGLAAALEETRAWEAALADALMLNDAARKAGVDSYEIGRYAVPLLKLKDRPGDMALAASLLADESIPRERVREFMQKLAADPEAAREEIAAAARISELEARYSFAVHTEAAGDFVLLPLQYVLPEAAGAVAEAGNIPLAARVGANTQPTLSVKALASLFPEDFVFWDKDGKHAAPPFLRKGERLFLMRLERPGASIFAGTPLEAVASTGPRIVEVDATILERLFFSGKTPGRSWDGYLIAAECGPEELAAHLGSLSVMRSARERSLYGPFADFTWDERHSSRYPSGRKMRGQYPKDVPGESYRLVQVRNPALFLALAPLADAKGLERLMGPVRAVWAKSRNRFETAPVSEIRYSPPSKTWKTYGLGKSPVLRLARTELAALVARRENAYARSWAAHTLRDCAENRDDAQCAEQYPAILAAMENEFAAIRAKGFVSPSDISEALFILKQFDDDPATLEKMRAVLDDRSLSSARRLAAMRAIAQGGKN